MTARAPRSCHARSCASALTAIARPAPLAAAACLNRDGLAWQRRQPAQARQNNPRKRNRGTAPGPSAALRAGHRGERCAAVPCAGRCRCAAAGATAAHARGQQPGPAALVGAECERSACADSPRARRRCQWVRGRPVRSLACVAGIQRLRKLDRRQSAAQVRRGKTSRCSRPSMSCLSSA